MASDDTSVIGRLTSMLREMAAVLSLSSGLCACGAVAARVPDPVRHEARPISAPDADVAPPDAEAEASPEPEVIEVADVSLPPALPAGRALSDLEPAECLALLRGVGAAFEEDSSLAGAAGVVPTGELGGVVYVHEGRSSVHSVMDCRLALALVAWGPTLRAAGVRRVRHLSALRPGARVASTGSRSGHASGLAVDLRFFDLGDGGTLDVLENWADRTRGAAPCEGAHDEPTDSALLRGLVCAAVRAELFQVVITPHHDDPHANHVHVELRPGVDWSWIR